MSISVERILELVKNSGKSEYAIKKETGLKNSAFSEWKAGRAKPSTDAIIILAKYFDVSADYLLGLTNTPTTVNAEKNPLPMERMSNDIISIDEIKRLLAENNSVDYVAKIYKALEQQQQMYVLVWLIEYAISEGLPIKQIFGI